MKSFQATSLPLLLRFGWMVHLAEVLGMLEKKPQHNHSHGWQLAARTNSHKLVEVEEELTLDLDQPLSQQSRFSSVHSSHVQK